MIRRRTTTAALLLAAGVLVLGACGGDDEATTTTRPTETTIGAEDSQDASQDASQGDTDAQDAIGGPDSSDSSDSTDSWGTDGASGSGDAADGADWAVDTDDCIDPDAANAPIEGTITIASVMPTSGGVAAAAYAPVKDGFEAYVRYANDNGLLDDVTIELAIGDDQFNPELTLPVASAQIDAGAHLFSGIIGTPNNEAVRERLNAECIPQLNALSRSEAWGEVAEHPWTTGLLVPYDVESRAYAAHIAERFPDGATVSLFFVDNEFGQAYAEAFNDLADEFGLTILGEHTIDANDFNPPVAQVTTIAGEGADVVFAVPLGAGCISFLTEMAIAEKAIAGTSSVDWSPQIYMSNTCANSRILGAAGADADGVITSGNLVDVTDPATAAIPEVAEYIAYMEGLGRSDVTGAAVAGWTAGEVTVAILAQAADSPQGLTRASIINAARNFEYTPSLARAGIVDRSQGEQDPYLAESLVVITYDADTRTFEDIGQPGADDDS